MWPNIGYSELITIIPVKVRGYPSGEPRVVIIEPVGEYSRSDLLRLAKIITEYAKTIPEVE